MALTETTETSMMKTSQQTVLHERCSKVQTDGQAETQRHGMGDELL